MATKRRKRRAGAPGLARAETALASAEAKYAVAVQKVAGDVWNWLEKHELSFDARLQFPERPDPASAVLFSIVTEGPLSSLLNGYYEGRGVEREIERFNKMLEKHGFYWDLENVYTVLIVRLDEDPWGPARR